MVGFLLGGMDVIIFYLICVFVFCLFVFVSVYFLVDAMLLCFFFFFLVALYAIHGSCCSYYFLIICLYFNCFIIMYIIYIVLDSYQHSPYEEVILDPRIHSLYFPQAYGSLFVPPNTNRNE